MKIQYSDSALEDLEVIWENDPDSAAVIESVLEEMEDYPELAEDLIKNHYRHYDDPSYEIRRFESLYHEGFNLYRMKCWDYEGSAVGYRVIYAYHPHPEDVSFILAVADRRGFDYEKDHPVVQRIIKDYRVLGIPEY